MSGNLKDILTNLNKDIEQEKLLQYLNRNMNDAEQQSFEKQMNDDDFMNDAVEGLESLENRDKIPELVQQLNGELQILLEKKKKKKSIKALHVQPWVNYTIILLLLLIVIAFIIIKKIA